MRLARIGISLVTLTSTLACLTAAPRAHAAPSPALTALRERTLAARDAHRVQLAHVQRLREQRLRSALRSAGAPQPARAIAARASGPDVVSASDLVGGTYIAWQEPLRDGVDGDVVLLHVTSAGAVYPGWPADGLVIGDTGGFSLLQGVVADGSGGVIVTWMDTRNGFDTVDLYAQRVSAAGAPLWTTNGVVMRSNVSAEVMAVAADGTGGLLAAWTARGAADMDVFATRIDASGAHPAGWSASGVLVCNAAGDAENAVIAADGSGGAYVAWEDERTLDALAYIYAQHLGANGAAQWAANGQLIAPSSLYETPAACSDGGSGLLLFWADQSTYVVTGVKLDGAGASQWGSMPSLSDVGDYASSPFCLADGQGGAIVYWDNSSLAGFEIHAQRVSNAGAIAWGASGASIVGGNNAYADQMAAVADGSGGAFFAWPDYSQYAIDQTLSLSAQRVTAAGGTSWGASGETVGTRVSSGVGGIAIDGSGGLLLAWQAYIDPFGLAPEVHVQDVAAAGTLAFPTAGAVAFRYGGLQPFGLLLQTDAGGVMAVYLEFGTQGDWAMDCQVLDASGTPLAPSRAIATGTLWPLPTNVISDGAGGAFVAWTDSRSGNQKSIYAQRLDSGGNPLWNPAGVLVCTGPEQRQATGIAYDGSGGVIVAWYDYRDSTHYDTYLQRLNASGTAQWTANGVPIGVTPDDRSMDAMTVDGSGGVILAWTKGYYQVIDSVMVQRFDASGARLWGGNGAMLTTFSSDIGASLVGLVPGTSHDAIALIAQTLPDTSHTRNRFYSEFTHLLALKMNSSGVAQWSAQGTRLNRDSSSVATYAMVPDGAGGAYVGWTDDRSGASDLFAQHVNAAGSAQWTADGVPICTAAGFQRLGGMTLDPAGDLYLAWDDHRGADNDVYAQRVNSSGVAQWTAGGRAICTAARGQFATTLAPFRTISPARLYVGWADNRAGNQRLMYAQRLDLTGAAQWTANGLTSTTLALVATDASAAGVRLTWFASSDVSASVERRVGEQGTWTPIGQARTDGSGYVRFVDRDVVPGTSYDYRLSIVQDGRTFVAGQTHVTVPITLALDLAGAQPNPAVGALTVAFTLPRAGAATLEVVDLAGRRVAARDLTPLGAGRHTLDLTNATPRAGVYFLRLTQGGRTLQKRAVVIR